MGLKITLSGQTIVKPTALGPVANTDTKLLIYGAISKGPSFGTGRDVCLSCPGEEASSGHQRRLEIDFTGIALPVLSQRVAIFFFADDRCNVLFPRESRRIPGQLR